MALDMRHGIVNNAGYVKSAVNNWIDKLSHHCADDFGLIPCAPIITKKKKAPSRTTRNM